MTVALKQTGTYRFEIDPSSYPGMRVPGIVWSDEILIRDIRRDESLLQLAQAATLPGVVRASMAMPDIHMGYGLPIGGVLAMDAQEGLVSPGATGYDINCGVRLAATELKAHELKHQDLNRLIDSLYRHIPVGVGSHGAIKVKGKQAAYVMEKGAAWAVSQGYGELSDLQYTESAGSMPGADPDQVSPRAFERGRNQLGTLGAGNHFIEIQEVEHIFDQEAAAAYGLFQGQLILMIHSGSRGLGHQVCTDYVGLMKKSAHKYGIHLPNPQLACAPISSDEGLKYLAAMKCAANYAWANRQCMMSIAREVFQRALSISPNELGFRLVYDVAHNIIKFEKHQVEGKIKLVAVHRKGATRAFPAGHPDIPESYRQIGQPVLIPGSMGTASYVLKGSEFAMRETFGTTNHGAGRVLSRTAAKKKAQGRSIASELEAEGIIVRAGHLGLLAEEMPEAYKDVDRVVEVVHNAGLAAKVARLKPLAVIKG